MQKLINYIQNTYGKDISCYSYSFLHKTINQRIEETGSKHSSGYLDLIRKAPSETEKLFSSLNISYSLFFRNPIDFLIIERFLLPNLFRNNCSINRSVRIWSAACAYGQEPYSLAIVADDLIKNQFTGCNTMILATDISEVALAKARKGEYLPNVVQNVKYSYFISYFERKGQIFAINDTIKQKVEFVAYDLLDPNTTSPPSGIFSEYDIIICCNLLIYYKSDIQKTILIKLYNSLSEGGFLIVDVSERHILKSSKDFKLYNTMGNIFKKR